jgi:hypothetical protein
MDKFHSAAWREAKRLIRDFEKEINSQDEPSRQRTIEAKLIYVMNAISATGHPSGDSEEYIEACLQSFDSDLQSFLEKMDEGSENKERIDSDISNLLDFQSFILFLDDLRIKLRRYSSTGGSVLLSNSAVGRPGEEYEKPTKKQVKRRGPIPRDAKEPFSWRAKKEQLETLYEYLVTEDWLEHENEIDAERFYSHFTVKGALQEESSLVSGRSKVNWIGTIPQLGALLKALNNRGFFAVSECFYKKAEYHFFCKGKAISAKALNSNARVATKNDTEIITRIIEAACR